MPSTMTLPVTAQFEEWPGRIHWTREDCDVLEELGVLPKLYELIDGELLSKVGQSPAHSYTVSLVNTWLFDAFEGMRIRIMAPVNAGDAQMPDNAPLPDVLLTKTASPEYAKRHPGPRDVALAVEVSDSSIRFDLTKKAALYASAGYVEYWVIDINARRIVVHREPREGSYADVLAYREDESVAPLADRGASILVSALLPPML